MRFLPIKFTIYLLIIFLASSAAFAAKLDFQDPVKLADGQFLKLIYFFPHWWEPWQSDDSALTADLQKMKSLGLNTVCLDHEVSQAVNKDWYWLDREYRLAGQEKMYILPWLQLQSVDRESLSGFSKLQLKPAVNQDGQLEDNNISFYDKEFKNALVKYVSAYLDRYEKDPALLKINLNGKVRPVVGLMVETGWRNPSGFPLSFDDETSEYFRKWMKASYYNLNQLNSKWGTKYKSFDEIDPRDKSVFNYDFSNKENMPTAVKEHINFRVRLIRDTMLDVAREVRKRHKDVLFVAEIAYPFSADTAEAKAYRWNNANDIRIVDFADLVCIRTVGGTSKDQVKKEYDQLILHGKKVLLAYRFMDSSTTSTSVAFALDCALSGNALGCYNWNEMAENFCAIYNSPERQELVKLMTGAYDMLLTVDKRHDAAPKPSVANMKPGVEEGALPPASVSPNDIQPAQPENPVQ